MPKTIIPDSAEPAPKKAPKPKLGLLEIFKLWLTPIRQLYPYLRPYRARFVFGLLFGAGFGATNGLIPLVLQQVVSIVPGGGTASKMQLLQNAQNTDGPTINSVVWLCSLIPLVIIVRSIFSYLNAYCMAWVSLRVLSDLRKDLFTHIMGQSLDFFHKNRSGDLISRVSNDPRMAQMALTTISSDLVTQPIAIVTSVGVLLFLDWKFTVISLGLFPICMWPIIYFGRKIRKSGSNEEDEFGAMTVILQEAFAGIRVIKSFAREKYQNWMFNESSNQQFDQSIRTRRSIEIVGPLIEGISAIGAGITILYVYLAGIPAGKFMGLLAGLFLLYDPIKKLSRIHIMMQRTFGATEKVFTLLQQESTIQDSPNAVAVKQCRGRLTFEHVTFSYRAKKSAVEDVNFDFEAGKYYALVGSSGAGKSTMLNMILRFYDPKSGVVRLDGRDLRELKQDSLRDKIGVVTQDTFLFHESIMTNIRYGRLEATDEEVIAAARLAHAHEFILAQPHGYKTVIGDKGCMISGGQQQRLAIARALLKDAPILLLDEATSSLDSESEQMIQSALELLSSGRTVIAIAHRLSTILKADKILVMQEGRIVDAGTHQELLSDSAIYRRLYSLQFNHADTPAEAVLVS